MLLQTYIQTTNFVVNRKNKIGSTPNPAEHNTLFRTVYCLYLGKTVCLCVTVAFNDQNEPLQKFSYVACAFSYLEFCSY